MARLWQVSCRDEDVGEKGGAEVDAFGRRGGDATVKDFVAKGTEDNEAKFDVHVYEASAVADESF